MPGLLYYLPRVDPRSASAFTLDQARAAGLGHAFERTVVASGYHGDAMAGPGLIVCDPARVHKPGYYPDRQTWRSIPGSDARVGFFRDQRPGPADLARAEQLDGPRLALADGNRWTVPLARAWLDGDSQAGWYHVLPRGLDLDANASWVAGDVLDRYQPLWQIACRWWDAKHQAIAAMIARSEGEDPDATLSEPLTFDDEVSAAIAVLSFNYRVAAAEVALLRLFTTTSPAEILDATVDWPTYAAWRTRLVEKKTAPPSPRPETSTTPPGEAAGPPDTARP